MAYENKLLALAFWALNKLGFEVRFGTGVMSQKITKIVILHDDDPNKCYIFIACIDDKE